MSTIAANECSVSGMYYVVLYEYIVIVEDDDIKFFTVIILRHKVLFMHSLARSAA